MPPFLCCSTSTRSFPILPEQNLQVVRPLAKNGQDDSASEVHGDATLASKHTYKLQALLNETLLPGQLPDPSRDAAAGRSIDDGKKTGVPLLEDTLNLSTNSRYHASALDGKGKARELWPAEPVSVHSSARTLRIPTHLQSTSATFSADYRDGEQVMSPASFSEAPLCRPSSGHNSADGTSGTGTVPSPCQAVPSLESLWLLLEPPLLRSVSRKSGQRRLYRQFPVLEPESTSDAACGPHVQFQGIPTLSAPSMTSAAMGRRSSQGTTGMAGQPSRTSCSVVALQQLQRELDTAEALPLCPLLLLPHRVYAQPQSVHVVYDGAGEYVDLYTYLQAQQRLPEASCRKVMRQLLQALSVLHERRWVHRNISTETVWLTEGSHAQQAQAARQARAQASDRDGPQSQTQTQTPISGPEPFSGEQLVETDALSEPSISPKSDPTASAVAVIDARASTDTAAVPVDGAGGRSSNSSNMGGTGAHHTKSSTGWVPATEDPRVGAPTAVGGPSEAAASQGGLDPAAESARASCSGSSTVSVSGCGGSGSAAAAAAQQQQQQQRRQRSQPMRQLHVKLGGLALAVRPHVDSASGHETPLRELVGCAYHLAPEAISGAGYSRPADVWAAGVLLYMLLTGRSPFPGRNELEVMTRTLLAATESRPRPPGQELDDPETPRPGSARPAPVALAPGPPHSQLPGQPEEVTTERAGRADATGAGAIRRTSRADGHSSSGGASGGGGADDTARRTSEEAGPSGRRASGGVDDSGTRPPPQQHHHQQQHPRNVLQELVVQAVLEARASAACREVLSSMLAAEPKRRLTAAELLRLPWFAAGQDGEEQQ